MRSIKVAITLFASVVLAALVDSPPRVSYGTFDSSGAQLPANIVRQLRLIERLAYQKLSARRPDPRLFGAITHLEEMLPRSPRTKRLQEEGRRLYIECLRSRSASGAARWKKMRDILQRRIEQDVRYVRALKAVDQRLAASVAAVPLNTSPPALQRSLPLAQMRPGDIMIWDDRSGRPFIRFAVSLFAWKCTHSAIYLGEQRTPHGHSVRLTYEALNVDRGVRVSPMDQKWMRHGLHVSLGHVNGFTSGASERIVRNAVQQFGSDGRTPYHIWPPWDKTVYTGGLYCSQLVWRIYNQSGTDLDSNDWTFLTWFSLHNWYDPYAPATAYFGVFPDEIKTSPHITWYYDQVNP